MIPKQRYLGRFIGGLKFLAQRSQFYISILNFFMILTLYYLKMREIKLNVFGFIINFRTIPFWLFLLMLLIIYGVVVVIDYIYILPSEISFVVWQQYKHDNPLVKDVRRLEERINKLEQKVDEIYKLLKQN